MCVMFMLWVHPVTSIVGHVFDRKDHVHGYVHYAVMYFICTTSLSIHWTINFQNHVVSFLLH